MKVFIAIIMWDYEGEEILGVFSTKRKAQNCIDRAANSGRYFDNSDAAEYEVK